MTEILCKWLNDTIKVSKRIEPSNFAEDLSSGYFIGEILNRHGLQDDFDQFSQNKSATSKLNNFMRLQPTINLLGIEFNTNIAREIMQEKPGPITQLLYQMFIALTNKEKRNLTGPIIESLRPAAPVKLEKVFETKLFQNNLKAKTTRQTDLDLALLRNKYDKYQAEQEQAAFHRKFQEEENQRSHYQEKRSILLNKSKEFKQKQAELYSKIKAAVVQVPKTPPQYTKEAVYERRRLFEKNEGERALREIDGFEKRNKSKKMDNDLNLADLEENRGYDDSNEHQNKLDPTIYLSKDKADEYINKIRSRLQEDAHARKEREKRRRKVLVDQLKANEALEESKREEALVSHLLRQSQFERRIAVELLHARHEKDVIRENRIVYEREVLAKRELEFRDAMDRERELARLAKLEYFEQVKKDKEFHDLIAAERAEAKYKKHYEICSELVGQIFDFSMKVAEYRELTDDLIPPKLWRDWLSMFRSGEPIYEEIKIQEGGKGFKEIESIFNADIVSMNEEKAKLLDEFDFKEYKEMIGEWEFTEQITSEKPPAENKILGHIIQRLHDIVYPVQPGAPKPIFPEFPLKVVVLGKPFAGKTTALKSVAKMSGLNVLNTDDLILEAIEQYRKDIEVSNSVDLKNLMTNLDNVSCNPSENPAVASNQGEVEEPKKGENLLEEKRASVKDTLKLQYDQLVSFSNCTTLNEFGSINETSWNEMSAGLQTIPNKSAISATNPVHNQILDGIKRYHADSKMVVQLGEIAFNSLNAGEPVKDEIIVHILCETIRTLPQEKGWIIDGFPSTYAQAKLLEKALTGFEEDNQEPAKPKHQSFLAPNPKPQESKPEHKSSIDLVIYLDITNDNVLKRSVGRYCGSISQNLYHLQFNQPPEGSHTGVNKMETIDQVKDPSNDMEQIQHRITLFEDNWSQMKSLYVKYSSVTCLSAEEFDYGALANSIQNELESFVNEREKKKQMEIEHKRMVELMLQQKKEEEERARLARKKMMEEEAALAAAEAEKAENSLNVTEEKPVTPSSKGKRSVTKDAAKSKSPKGSKKAPSPAPSKAKSPTASKLGKNRSKATTPVNGITTPTHSVNIADTTDQSIPQVDPPKPGSPDWVFVDEKLDNTIAKILSDHWDVTESSYINGSKHVFRKIRSEREQIIRYFFNIKTTFKTYLKRPDSKQVFVDAFVKEYNRISDDMRDDEEVKAELHQRVSDLMETLWNICDTKKSESEREREAVMNNGWLPDKTGILTNHYITLMQTELDRFQDTARMLKDYYKCMANPVPEEIAQDYPRLALLDLKNPDEVEDDIHFNIGVGSEKSDDGKASPKESLTAGSPRNRSKSPKSKSPSSSKKTSQIGTVPGPVAPVKIEHPKKKIPLISRRPGSSEKEKKPSKVVKPKNPDEASPLPPEDPDEQLVFQAFKNACSFVNTIIQQEQAAVTASEMKGEAPPVVDDPKGKGRKQSVKPPSAAKGKSPKGAKGAPPPVVVSSEGPSEEDREKQAALEKSNKEYMTALKKEENDFKNRLELIKLIANKVITELKARADNSYRDMNEWLGARFQKEINSIQNLCNYVKFQIEHSKKIKKELILNQDDFIINADVIVMRTPSPPPRPISIETPSVENFSIDSLRKIFKQFQLVAPEGLVTTKAFIDIFNDLMLLNFGNEILPEQWSNLTQTQIEHLARMLASGSEFVDWRNWLLAASMPWKYPTQTQLLELLQLYKKVDKLETGYITKNQFLQTPLWFKFEKPGTPADTNDPHSFDRHMSLINFWFDLFSMPVPVNILNQANLGNTIQTEEKLDYKNMLISMSSVSDPYEGFLRALSVSQESPMPQIEPKIQMKVPSFNTHEYEQLKLASAISETFPEDQMVSIDAIYRVFHHGERQRGDTHRFAQTEDPEDFMSYQRVATIFAEINEEPNPVALYSKLIAHPVLCEMISICTKFRTPDFRTVFQLQSNIEENERDRDSPNE